MMFSENRRPFFRIMLQGEFSCLVPEPLWAKVVRLVRSVLLHQEDRMLIASCPRRTFERKSHELDLLGYSMVAVLQPHLVHDHHAPPRGADRGCTFPR